MYTDIFDTHAHYDDEQFEKDRACLLSSLLSSDVSLILNCGTDIASSKKSLKLAESHSRIFAACGIHPHESASAANGDIEELLSLSRHEKCVAIGEIGLDYHYDFSPHEIQLHLFEQQLILADELNLPVIIHDREAHADTLELLKKHRPKGVLHCFSGSAEMAQEIVKLGMYIGLGGAVTFKNAKKPIDVAKSIPLERMLLETDCPYMSPVPFRGQRNDSSFIKYTAEAIAKLRDITPQELITVTAENGKKLFALI